MLPESSSSLCLPRSLSHIRAPSPFLRQPLGKSRRSKSQRQRTASDCLRRETSHPPGAVFIFPCMTRILQQGCCPTGFGARGGFLLEAVHFELQLQRHLTFLMPQPHPYSKRCKCRDVSSSAPLFHLLLGMIEGRATSQGWFCGSLTTGSKNRARGKPLFDGSLLVPAELALKDERRRILGVEIIKYQPFSISTEESCGA